MQQNVSRHDADDLGIVLVLGQFPVARQPVADDLGTALDIPLDEVANGGPRLVRQGLQPQPPWVLSSSISTAPMISSLPTFGCHIPRLGRA